MVEAEQDSRVARAKVNSHGRHADFMMEKKDRRCCCSTLELFTNLKERKKHASQRMPAQYVKTCGKLWLKKTNVSLAERNGIGFRDGDKKKSPK